MQNFIWTYAIWRVSVVPRIESIDAAAQHCIVIARWYQDAIDVAFEYLRKFPSDDEHWIDTTDEQWTVIFVERLFDHAMAFGDEIITDE